MVFCSLIRKRLRRAPAPRMKLDKDVKPHQDAAGNGYFLFSFHIPLSLQFLLIGCTMIWWKSNVCLLYFVIRNENNYSKQDFHDSHIYSNDTVYDNIGVCKVGFDHLLVQCIKVRRLHALIVSFADWLGWCHICQCGTLNCDTEFTGESAAV